MKKSNLFVLAAIALWSMIFSESHAQVAMNSPRLVSADEATLLFKGNNRTSGTWNLNAERNFKKDYRQAIEPQWSILSDNSFMCRFFMNNILNRAFYTAHGHWIGTVSSYDASKLDKGIYNKIKSTYYDYRIVFVNQIDMVNGKTVYVVEINNEKSIKKIRVDDDEMEIVQEFVNQ